ncbi:MAG: hypothetical protein ABIJ00_11530 [Candidatus Eisenbacteria bacterium]
MLRIYVLAALLCVLLSAAGFAGSNEKHKVALHILPHESRSCSENFPVIEQCPGIIHTYLGCGEIDVFPVFFDLIEVTALEYGLTWPAVWGNCVYTACGGDVINGNIASPGDGISHQWSSCRQVPVIIPGYAWVGIQGLGGGIAPVAHPGTGLIGTTDCDAGKDVPLGIYSAGVCGVPGDDPCCLCGTRKTTWGEIRMIFR